MLTIESVRDFARLEHLAPSWNALLRRSRADCVFLTWQWVDSWWQVYGEAYQPLVLLARDPAGELVGVAPLMVARGAGLFGRGLRTVMFVGHNEDVTPEYLDWFCALGLEQQMTAAVCDHLAAVRGDWDRIQLAHMRSDSPSLLAAQQRLAHHGIALRAGDEVACPHATLPPSWDEYLVGRSRNFRAQLARSRRGLERQGRLRVLQAGPDLPVLDALDALVALNRARWGGRGESFRTERYLEFHRTLCPRLEQRGWLSLSLLELEGQVVAARYDFRYGGKQWNYQGGWLQEFARQRVAMVLQGAVLCGAIEQGCVEYDFLAGDEAYKRRWATGSRDMVLSLQGWSPAARGRVLRSARQGKRWVADRLIPRATALLGGS